MRTTGFVVAGVLCLAAAAAWAQECDPVVLSTFHSPGSVEGVAVEGDLAYLADGVARLTVLDVSDPTASVLLGGVDTPNGPSTSSFRTTTSPSPAPSRPGADPNHPRFAPATTRFPRRPGMAWHAINQ